MIIETKFENFKDNKIDIIFVPSGEIFNLTNKDIKELDDYIIMDYNKAYEAYMIEDDYKDLIIMVLGDKKK